MRPPWDQEDMAEPECTRKCRRDHPRSRFEIRFICTECEHHYAVPAELDEYGCWKPERAYDCPQCGCEDQDFDNETSIFCAYCGAPFDDPYCSRCNHFGCVCQPTDDYEYHDTERY